MYDAYRSTATPFNVKFFLWRSLNARDPAHPLPMPEPPPDEISVSTGPAPMVAVISRKNGGTARRSDGVAVTVPAGALSQDTVVTIASATFHSQAEERGKAASMAAQGLAPAGSAVELGPSGLGFSAAATLVLPYDRALVMGQGLSEANLKVYGWSPASFDWQALASIPDAVTRTVSARVTHFSLYQVLGSSGAAASAAAGGSASFALRDAYAFPNPAKHGAAVTFRMQVGPADAVTVRVHGPDGRVVFESADFQSAVFDDGNGKGSLLTYSLVWNAGGRASGVYVYVLVAHKAGQRDIVKTGKIALVR